MRKNWLSLFVAGVVALGFGAVVHAQGFVLQPGSVVQGYLTTQPSGNAGAPAPTVAGASCGVPVLTQGSTDFAGSFQAKGTSTCKLTFGTVKVTAPACTVVDATTASTYTVSTTGITMGTTVSNDFIYYTCVNYAGN